MKPIHIVSKKLLSLSRELTLRNFPLSHNAVLALAASLKDNRHIQVHLPTRTLWAARF